MSRRRESPSVTINQGLIELKSWRYEEKWDFVGVAFLSVFSLLAISHLQAFCSVCQLEKSMKVIGGALALATFLLLLIALGITGASFFDALETALNPFGIAYELNLDQDGDLIVSDYGAGEVWQINPATNVYTIYQGATSATDARVDSSGNMWWTDIDSNIVGRYSVGDDTVTEWFIESAQWLFGLAIDDQDRIWVGDAFDTAMFRIDLANTQLCTYTINTRSDYILYDEGDLWLGDWFEDRITRLDTETNVYYRWHLPPGSSVPGGMAMDDQSKLWWADPGLDALASLDPVTNILTTYTLPSGYSDPKMVSTASSGVWFSEQGVGTAGLLDPAQATGITTTLTVSGPSSGTPDCQALGTGTNYASSTMTGTVSWSGVTLNLLSDEDGWLIYELPQDGDPWGIANLLNRAYVVDQGRQKLVAIEGPATLSTIILIKDPTNDDGGNAAPDDFNLSVGGVVVSSGVPYTITANTNYAINETLVDGYVFESITGNPKCPAVLGGQVNLEEGEDITCTITNDDIAPTLTLVKDVINDNGGNAGPDDFGISVGGVGVSSGVPYTVAANTTYTIDEVGLDGYTFTSITGNPKCPAALGGSVTLDEGEDITCIITNDDDLPPSSDYYVFLPYLIKP